MNRVAIVFLIGASLLLGMAMLYASRFYDAWATLDASRLACRLGYLQDSLSVTKFVLVTTGLFLNLHCFSAGNGRYSAFFVTDNHQRIRFMATKLGMIGLLLTMMTANAWLMYHWIGRTLTPYFAVDAHETMLFLAIGLEASIFGLFEAILMQLSESLFSGILPLIFFWFLEALGIPENLIDNPWIRTFYQIIPHLIPDPTGFQMESSFVSPGLLVICLFLMNILIFQRRDIK